MVVFGAPNHVLVYDVVVCFLNMLICHVREPREALELVACDKVVGLLACKELKYLLRFTIQIQVFVQISMLWNRQYQFQLTLFRYTS